MKLKEIAAMLAIAGVGAPAFAEEMSDSQVKPTDETSVATPEMNTIAKTVEDGRTFSILESALKAAGLTETLAGKGPYTVFAPTDEAFGKLDSETLDKLMLPENKEKLRSLLLYHVVAGQMHAANFTDGDVKSANGEKLEVDVEDGRIEIEDSTNVVNADLAASNGVIHVVDRVLVPESLDGFLGLDED